MNKIEIDNKINIRHVRLGGLRLYICFSNDRISTTNLCIIF